MGCGRLSGLALLGIILSAWTMGRLRCRQLARLDEAADTGSRDRRRQ